MSTIRKLDPTHREGRDRRKTALRQLVTTAKDPRCGTLARAHIEGLITRLWDVFTDSSRDSASKDRAFRNILQGRGKNYAT